MEQDRSYYKYPPRSSREGSCGFKDVLLVATSVTTALASVNALGGSFANRKLDKQLASQDAIIASQGAALSDCGPPWEHKSEGQLLHCEQYAEDHKTDFGTIDWTEYTSGPANPNGSLRRRDADAPSIEVTPTVAGSVDGPPIDDAPPTVDASSTVEAPPTRDGPSTFSTVVRTA